MMTPIIAMIERTARRNNTPVSQSRQLCERIEELGGFRVCPTGSLARSPDHVESVKRGLILTARIEPGEDTPEDLAARIDAKMDPWTPMQRYDRGVMFPSVRQDSTDPASSDEEAGTPLDKQRCGEEDVLLLSPKFSRSSGGRDKKASPSTPARSASGQKLRLWADTIHEHAQEGSDPHNVPSPSSLRRPRSSANASRHSSASTSLEPGEVGPRPRKDASARPYTPALVSPSDLARRSSSISGAVSPLGTIYGSLSAIKDAARTLLSRASSEVSLAETSPTVGPASPSSDDAGFASHEIKRWRYGGAEVTESGVAFGKRRVSSMPGEFPTDTHDDDDGAAQPDVNVTTRQLDAQFEEDTQTAIRQSRRCTHQHLYTSESGGSSMVARRTDSTLHASQTSSATEYTHQDDEASIEGLEGTAEQSQQGDGASKAVRYPDGT